MNVNIYQNVFASVRIMSDPIRRSPPSKSTVKVLCVDYGNVGEVDMNTLLPIYSAQSVMPAQAAKLAISKSWKIFNYKTLIYDLVLCFVSRIT